MFIYFGTNAFNQLNDIEEEITDISLPSKLKCFSQLSAPNKEKINDIYVSWSFLLFKTDDKVYHTGFWGKNHNLLKIKQVPSLSSKEIVEISCGFKNSLVLIKSGQCFAFTDQYFHPELIDFGESNGKIKSVRTDDLHSIALTVDGKVYALIGEAKLSPLFPKLLPMPVQIKEVACGKQHVLLLSNCGKIFSYGYGSRGQLGHGTIENLDEPMLIDALDGININTVSCGGWHSAAISNEGDLYMWGWNESGQLGLPCNELQGGTLPMDQIETVCCLPKIVDIEDEIVRDIGCGSRHTAVLTVNNHLWTWGWNNYGQLGHDKVLLSDTPEKVDLPEYFHPLKLKCKFWSTLIYGSLKD